MNKYERHKGIVKVKIDDDEFILKPSIDEWAKMISELSDTTDGKLSKENIISIGEVIKSALKRGEPDASVEDISDVVDGNFMVFMEGFMGSFKNPGNDRFKQQIVNRINEKKQ